MRAGDLRHRIDVWGKVKTKNELNETTYDDAKIKTIWAEIISQKGSNQKQEADTILANVSHKITCRYVAGKDIVTDMYFKYRDHRFDIKYVFNPNFANKSIEFFCEEVIE